MDERYPTRRGCRQASWLGRGASLVGRWHPGTSGCGGAGSHAAGRRTRADPGPVPDPHHADTRAVLEHAGRFRRPGLDRQQAFVGLGAYAMFALVLCANTDPLLAIALAGLAAGLIAIPVTYMVSGCTAPILRSAHGSSRKCSAASGAGQDPEVGAPAPRCPNLPPTTRPLLPW